MQTIAVIFGGRSAEHDVSIITALASVIKPLELTNKYRVEAIYIAKDGSWYWDEKLKDISLFSSGRIDQFLRKNRPVQMQLDGGLTVTKFVGLKRKFCKIDIVFPSMHGTYGEDGSLMGMLDMAGIPYVGCGLSASVVAMDKVLSKEVASAHGIPSAKYVSFFASNYAHSESKTIKHIESTVQYPVFVKPAHLGSSIGISRATNTTELTNAVEVALHYDDRVIVEEEVKNLIEVTLPIIGNDELTPALLERPLTSSEDFFDFETKYMNGGKKGGQKSGKQGAQGYSELPAQLSKELYKRAEELGLAVYRAVGCSGIARIDMLIDQKSQKVYFNEINPLPGSLYVHNWRASGISTVDLVDRLIRLAVDKHTSRKKIETTFDTNYLKQF